MTVKNGRDYSTPLITLQRYKRSYQLKLGLGRTDLS